MDVNKYLQELTKQIHNSERRVAIMEEYAAHIDDCKDALIESGMTEQEALEEAVRQMGDPVQAGREMNRLYRDMIDYKMLIWTLVCGAVAIVCRFWLMKSFWNQDALEAGNRPETIQFIYNVLAVFFIILGLTWSAVEKYLDSSLFYAWAENWYGGGVINSGVFLALAVVFIQANWQSAIVWALVLALVQAVERTWIMWYQSKCEQRLLWQIGKAETIINYKGKAVFQNKKRKVKAQDTEIPQGAPVMIVELKGFKPIVVQI